jgi:hypothetical protein
LVIEVVETQKADLIAFRPLLITTAEAVVGTDTFGDVFELAARHAHELFTDQPGSNVVLRANEAALLLIDTVRTVAPDVADRIPVDVEPALLNFRDSASELRLYRSAERVRALGVILPIMGVLAWGGAVLLASDRRRMLRNLGVTLTGLGILLLVGIRVGGHVVADHFDLPLERQAATDVWHTFLDGLGALAWFGIVGGLILAASVQALARDESRLSPARIRQAVVDLASREPRTTWAKVLVGVGLMVLGAFMFVSPTEVVAAAVTILGAFVFYGALVFLLDALVRPVDVGVGVGVAADPADVAEPSRRARGIAVAGALGVFLVAGIGIYLVVSSPEATAGLQACNGRIEYCTRRLDQLAFPTTHNSMTAADDGFLLANQEEGIARQLRDGVRGFQIDAYLGSVRTNGGVRVVFTDLTDAKLAEIAAATTPELAQQALQFRAIVGPPPENARQDVFLCHNFCELGAVKMSDEVDVIRRFLERNPNEVLLIVVQDELDAQELDTVLRRGGLTRYLATIDPDRPMPTLASLIASGRRVVLGLENGRLGRRIPNVFADGLVQEVPYNYRTVAELDGPDACLPLRGQPDAPLFQFNHWVTPASRGAARQANAHEFLVGRAERCARERDLVPALVAVDFYKTGDLFRVVEELNAGG